MVEFQDFLPENIKQHIDFESAQNYSNQSVTRTGEMRYDDIVYLFKAKKDDSKDDKAKKDESADDKTGKKEAASYCILVILECQGTVDKTMPWRVLEYVSLNVRKVLASQGDHGKPPYILPLVFYFPAINAPSHWNGPVSTLGTYEIKDIPSGLLEYIPQHKFFLIDAAAFSKESLSEGKSAIAGFVELSSLIRNEQDFPAAFCRAILLIAKHHRDDVEALGALAEYRYDLPADFNNKCQKAPPSAR